jgi:hypothetical protein
MGEYLVRIPEESRDRPLYNVAGRNNNGRRRRRAANVIRGGTPPAALFRAKRSGRRKRRSACHPPCNDSVATSFGSGSGA